MEKILILLTFLSVFDVFANDVCEDNFVSPVIENQSKGKAPYLIQNIVNVNYKMPHQKRLIETSATHKKWKLLFNTYITALDNNKNSSGLIQQLKDSPYDETRNQYLNNFHSCLADKFIPETLNKTSKLLKECEQVKNDEEFIDLRCEEKLKDAQYLRLQSDQLLDLSSKLKIELCMNKTPPEGDGSAFYNCTNSKEKLSENKTHLDELGEYINQLNEKFKYGVNEAYDVKTCTQNFDPRLAVEITDELESSKNCSIKTHESEYTYLENAVEKVNDKYLTVHTQLYDDIINSSTDEGVKNILVLAKRFGIPPLDNKNGNCEDVIKFLYGLKPYALDRTVIRNKYCPLFENEINNKIQKINPDKVESTATVIGEIFHEINKNCKKLKKQLGSTLREYKGVVGNDLVLIDKKKREIMLSLSENDIFKDNLNMISLTYSKDNPLSIILPNQDFMNEVGSWSTDKCLTDGKVYNKPKRNLKKNIQSYIENSKQEYLDYGKEVLANHQQYRNIKNDYLRTERPLHRRRLKAHIESQLSEFARLNPTALLDRANKNEMSFNEYQLLCKVGHKYNNDEDNKQVLKTAGYVGLGIAAGMSTGGLGFAAAGTAGVATGVGTSQLDHLLEKNKLKHEVQVISNVARNRQDQLDYQKLDGKLDQLDELDKKKFKDILIEEILWEVGFAGLGEVGKAFKNMGKLRAVLKNSKYTPSQLAQIKKAMREDKVFRDQIINDPELLERNGLAELSLGRKLNAKETKAAQKAHLVGDNELGKDGTPAAKGNYTWSQIRQKEKILNEAGFSSKEIRKLMEDGVVGKARVRFQNGQKQIQISQNRTLTHQLTTNNHKEMLEKFSNAPEQIKLTTIKPDEDMVLYHGVDPRNGGGDPDETIKSITNHGFFISKKGDASGSTAKHGTGLYTSNEIQYLDRDYGFKKYIPLSVKKDAIIIDRDQIPPIDSPLYDEAIKEQGLPAHRRNEFDRHTFLRDKYGVQIIKSNNYFLVLDESAFGVSPKAQTSKLEREVAIKSKNESEIVFLDNEEEIFKENTSYLRGYSDWLGSNTVDVLKDQVSQPEGAFKYLSRIVNINLLEESLPKLMNNNLVFDKNVAEEAINTLTQDKKLLQKFMKFHAFRNNESGKRFFETHLGKQFESIVAKSYNPHFLDRSLFSNIESEELVKEFQERLIKYKPAAQRELENINLEIQGIEGDKSKVDELNSLKQEKVKIESYLEKLSSLEVN